MKIKPKKSLGQNFLSDKNIIKKIVEIEKIDSKSSILEIGPGTGNLTEFILQKKPKKITVIEKDNNLSKFLKEKFNDTIKIILELTSGPQILVGSSLGGWLSLLFARLHPQKVAGIIGIAAAPDFTSKYSTNNLTLEQRRELKNTGKLSFHSEYFEQPLTITKKLIEDGNKNLVLTEEQNINCPVRLFHGSLDEDVPISTSIEILKKMKSYDMHLQIIKGIDHRFSTPECLQLIKDAIEHVSLAYKYTHKDNHEA